jgi:hypothetical protein
VRPNLPRGRASGAGIAWGRRLLIVIRLLSCSRKRQRQTETERKQRREKRLTKERRGEKEECYQGREQHRGKAVGQSCFVDRTVERQSCLAEGKVAGQSCLAEEGEVVVHSIPGRFGAAGRRMTFVLTLCRWKETENEQRNELTK